MRGTVATGFEDVGRVFSACVAEEGPGGGAFCAYVGGHVVIDVVGGRGASADQPFEHDTVCVIASGTKGIVATAMLQLIERGLLDLDEPVATYWPEFAAAGKGAIRVADIVGHTAGLPGIVEPIAPAQLADPESIEAALAAQPPIVDVGHPSYHALTYGWLCDALVRHVDGRSIGRFVGDEIAGPLDLDLSIGSPPERVARVAPLQRAPDYRLSAYLSDEPPDERLAYVYDNPSVIGRMSDPAVLAYEVAGGGAVSTAGAMARLYACLAMGGELDGVRLLRPETVELGRRQLSSGPDPLSGRLLRFGVGFELAPNPSALGPAPDAFGHTGAGGSSHGAWPAAGVGYSFVTSLLRPEDDDGRAARLLAASVRLPVMSSSALTPDFDDYPDEPRVTAAVVEPGWVQVSWADGTAARYHHVWLRDNCPCPECVHQVTKEQTFELAADAVPHVEAAAPGTGGALSILWAADGHRSELHQGWLLAHRYDDGPTREPVPTTWDGSTPDVPFTGDGPAVLTDDRALEDWLLALRDYGLAVLREVPLDLDTVGRVAERIGPVRETNFGVLWDVRSEPTPITNANTAFALPPHVDLPTREYQPGLQFLHCIHNTAGGGDGRYLDGFRVAEIIRDEYPNDFEVLTTVPWQWANRSKVTDHRWAAPPITLDHDGRIREIRMGNWLRGPLAVEFGRVEHVYAAMRTMAAVAGADGMAIRLPLRPGDLVAFDNRRILHGRDAFDAAGGQRLLRGCYGERDELRSRLRILDRARRAVARSDPS